MGKEKKNLSLGGVGELGLVLSPQLGDRADLSLLGGAVDLVEVALDKASVGGGNALLGLGGVVAGLKSGLLGGDLNLEGLGAENLLLGLVQGLVQLGALLEEGTAVELLELLLGLDEVGEGGDTDTGGELGGVAGEHCRLKGGLGKAFVGVR